MLDCEKRSGSRVFKRRWRSHEQHKLPHRSAIYPNNTRKWPISEALSRRWKLSSWRHLHAHVHHVTSATIVCTGKATRQIRIQQRWKSGFADLIYRHMNSRGWEWRMPHVSASSGARNGRNGAGTHVVFHISSTRWIELFSPLNHSSLLTWTIS